MKIFEIKNQYRKGFGLLEVLISAVIIIIILSALVTIGRAALNNNEYLAERAQAIYLAQEGMETIRYMRDTSWIDGSSSTKWDNFRSATVAGGSEGCYEITDSTFFGIAACSQWSQGQPIKLESNGNVVTFNRRMNFTKANDSLDSLMPDQTNSPNLSDYAIKVTSTVTWKYSGQNKTVDLSEILTNWRPDF